MQPVTITRGSAAISGGGISSKKGSWAQPWVAPVHVYDGTEFVTVDRRSRGLARFLGYNMSTGNPLAGACWPNYLVALRDGEVDRLIAQNTPDEDTLRSEQRSRGEGGGDCCGEDQ